MLLCKSKFLKIQSIPLILLKIQYHLSFNKCEAINFRKARTCIEIHTNCNIYLKISIIISRPPTLSVHRLRIVEQLLDIEVSCLTVADKLAAVTGRSWPTEGRLGKAGDAATLTKWSHNPMMSLSRRSTRRYIKCRLITSPSSPPSPLRESGLDPRSYRKDTSNEKPTCCFASRNFSQKLQEGHL